MPTLACHCVASSQAFSVNCILVMYLQTRSNHVTRNAQTMRIKRPMGRTKIEQRVKLHGQNGPYPIWSTVHAHRFKIKQNQVKLVSTVSGKRVSCDNFHPSCDYDVKSLLLTTPNQLIRKEKDQSTLVRVI